MSDTDILYQAKGSIATITLNRVSRHNALTLQMLDDIDRAVADVERNDEIRVLKIETGTDDYYPGLSNDQKKDKLWRISYKGPPAEHAAAPANPEARR